MPPRFFVFEDRVIVSKVDFLRWFAQSQCKGKLRKAIGPPLVGELALRSRGRLPISPDSQVEGEKEVSKCRGNVDKEGETHGEKEDGREGRGVGGEKLKKKDKNAETHRKGTPGNIDNGTGGEEVGDGVFTRIAEEAGRNGGDKEVVLVSHATGGGESVVNEREVVKPVGTGDSEGNRREGVGDVVNDSGGKGNGGRRVG